MKLVRTLLKFIGCAIILLISNYSNAQLYFQQIVNYNIDVTLQTNNELNGNVTITYINQSPDSLAFLYIHLWPNAYKNNQTALCKEMLYQGNKQLYFAHDSLRGYIDKIEFKHLNKLLILKPDSLNQDIAKLELDAPLSPGDTITITTPFRVKIPHASFSRMGYDNGFYAITQWYPKVAVYDAQGWHAMPYLNQGEYYNNFGSYSVNVTLPKDFVVGATGNLITSEEINWMNQKANASKINNPEINFNKASLKTITFTADSVHDFAWFANKEYHVVKDSVAIGGKWITTWCLFTNHDVNYWQHATTYIHNALRFYSNEIGNYPYNQITVCSGTLTAGGGMEYPQVTVIGQPNSLVELETTIVHEIGHNWFQGIIASNERDEPWLDEGINSYYEMEYFLQNYPKQNVTDFNAIGLPLANLLGNKLLNAHQYKLSQYLSMARTWNNQPINLSAPLFTPLSYGCGVYAKSAVAFAYLKKYLGDSLFKQCMQQYFLRWKFMHPNTYALKNVIEDVSQQNVDWFFDQIIGTKQHVDYKIKSVSKHQPYTLKIKNKTGTTAPVFIDVDYSNHTEKICLNGFDTNALIALAEKPKKIIIDSGNVMMDVFMHNNYYNSKQLFKKQLPLHLKLYSSFNTNQSYLYYIPVVGWNQYNHLMPGVVLHNQSLVPKPFEFALMPMYSFSSTELCGSAMAQYQYVKNQNWQYTAKIVGMQYNFGNTYFLITDRNHSFQFKKIQPSFAIQHRSSVLSKSVHQLKATAYVINRNDVFEMGTIPSVTSKTFHYQLLQYSFNNHQTLDPWHASFNVEHGKQYMKLFTEAQYNFSYKSRQRGITIRGFAGTFIYNRNEIQNVNFRMSGFNGMQDYLFNNTFLGRSEGEGILSKQFIANDGAFKVNTAVGQTNKWLTSLNIQVTIPGLPIMFYLDAGTYYNAANAYEGSEALMYNGGICIWLIRDVIELYAPLFYSSDIKNNLSASNMNTFADKIRLQLHFDLLNPLKLQKQFLN